MRRVMFVLACVCGLASAAAAKEYSAERFDVTVRPLPDGSVQVTETVLFAFSGGPFTYVTREIPTRRTDGIEVLGASVDGRVLPRGDGPGTFEVQRRDSRMAIRWRFGPTSNAKHSFRLSYLARGVIRQTPAGGSLEWRALPADHEYRIQGARVVLIGSGTDAAPAVTTRRVAEARVDRSGDGWVIEARNIASDGWIAFRTSSPLAMGAMPRWQAREERQQALVPRMIRFGAIAAVLSLGLVLVLWRQYPSPPALDEAKGPAADPPTARPPAVAAAVLAGGRSSSAHAPATLFDLAGRGVVSIEEGERRWTGRRFTLRRRGPATLAPHEAALLDAMLGDAQEADAAKAASRLSRRGRAFRREVNEELHRLGLTDEHRGAARRRLLVAGFALAALSVVATVLIVVIYDAGPWGLAVPLGMDIAALLAIVVGATRAELSDAGFREREQWRGFKSGLKRSIGSGPDPESAAIKYLPYVAALGLAAPLSRLLKKHGAEAALPPWFRAFGDRDDGAAFAAFITTTTSGSGGGGGAGGGGAAGGGSSGAG